MNYIDTKNELKKYLKARIPFVKIDSKETDRVNQIMKEIHEETADNIYIYSMSKGMYSFSGDGIVSSEKTFIGILNFISNEITTKSNVTYVLNDVSELENDTTTSRFLTALVQKAEEKSCMIIVVSSDSVWPNLRRLGMNIKLDYPSSEEILAMLHSYLDKYKGRINIEWTEDNFKEASVILLGLSAAEIKNIVSIMIASESVTAKDLEEIKYAKDSLFSSTEGLEKVEVSDAKYVGLKGLKEWLDQKQKLFDVSNKEVLKARGIKPPRGVLIVGVPGCGKSLTAKAISKEWKLPLYLLDFATVQGRYVGQSEEQLKLALESAENVAPCVLWIDEIEKGLGAQDSSGVTTKMIGQFLYWLQECDKEVFVVATANDVSKLPAELLRKGRFDEIFFIDLPNNEERKAIINLYFEKYLKIKADEEFINSLVLKTNGFASSDIEAAIRDLSYNVIAGGVSLTKDFISNYFDNCTSISKTNKEKIEYIQKWGENRAKKAS